MGCFWYIIAVAVLAVGMKAAKNAEDKETGRFISAAVWLLAFLFIILSAYADNNK